MSALAKIGASTIGAAVVGAIAFALIAYGAFAGGYVASRVWAWHILPLGLGLPVIGWKAFWAIGAVSRLVFGYRQSEASDGERDYWKLADQLLAPWIILGFAWWLRP